MKLYSLDLSPYAARVRLAIYAKGCPVEMVPPPDGGPRTAAYRAINPIGKVPALVLDDGTVIPESQTIVEYLEDRFPEEPLRPGDAEGRARIRLIERVVEVYVDDPLHVLFDQTNPATRDTAVVEAELERLETGLEYLNVFMAEGPFAAGEAFTTADCAAIPILFYVNLIGRTFDRPQLLTRHGKIAAYWDFIGTYELASKVIGELKRGLAAFRSGA